MDDESVFGIALQLKDPADRAAYLDQACGDDLPRLQRIAELLESHQLLSPTFLDQPAVDPYPSHDTPTDRIGTQIGPYTLRELIGAGGMGLVYAAEQESPVRRKVALKIIKPGMDTREVISRFEAERQALAMMDHPHIARVLDAGATESGHPYFVMELVRGHKITRYCDENQLLLEERLKLFQQVCRAVQHAHQKGIIHRDIKPGNVLVTLHDGEPVPKVIDFGVAKAVDQRLSEGSVYTAVWQLLGTPAYMSPEQAELSGLDIDTRSDIYSLGVLLYEMLTGTTPFSSDQMSEAGLDEARRWIREVDPPRPSERVSTLKAGINSTVNRRQRMDSRSLDRTLKGELDWIVMKALEKDRTRRYETANELADDVGRYLANEPIMACPPSVLYRIRKLIQRKRGAVSVAFAIGLAVLIGVATLVGGYFREVLNQHEIRESLRLAVDGLQSAYLIARDMESSTSISESQRNALLSSLETTSRLCKRMEGQSETRTELVQLLVNSADLHRRIDTIDNALVLYRQAIAFCDESDFNDVSPDYSLTMKARALHGMGQCQFDLADPEALDTLYQASELWQGLSKSPKFDASSVFLKSKTDRAIAMVLSFQGKPIRALELLEESAGQLLHCQREMPSDDQIQHAIWDVNLLTGRIQIEVGEPELATSLLDRTYQQLLDMIPDKLTSPELTDHGLRRRLALAQRMLGKLKSTRRSTIEESEELLVQATKNSEEMCRFFPNNHDYQEGLSRSAHALAIVYQRQGKLDKAKTVLDHALKILEKRIEIDTRNAWQYVSVARRHEGLGLVKAELADLEMAQFEFRKAADIWGEVESRYGPYPEIIGNRCRCIGLLAGAIIAEAKLPKRPPVNGSTFPGVKDLLLEAYASLQNVPPDFAQQRPVADANLELCRRLSRIAYFDRNYDESEMYLRRAIALTTDFDNWNAANIFAQQLSNLANTQLAKSFEFENEPDRHEPLAQSARDIATEAIELQRRALESAVSDYELSKFRKDLARHHYVLGGAEIELGNYDEALKAYERSLELFPEAPFPMKLYVADLYIDADGGLEHQDLRRAEEIARDVIASDQDNRWARKSLAISLFWQGRYAEAIPHCELACGEDEDGRLANATLGMCLYRLGQFDRAASSLEKSYSVSATASLYLVMAVCRASPEFDGENFSKDDIDEFFQFVCGQIRAEGNIDSPEIAPLVEEASEALEEIGLMGK